MSAIKRNGFAMILAIFVVILVAGGGAILLSKSSMGSKSIGDNYIRAQAELLAQSATEYALMRAQDVNTSAPNTCLRNLNINVTDATGQAMFDINVSLGYSFKGVSPAECHLREANLSDMTGQDTMVLIDVSVKDHNLSTEPIRIHKRSWQKL